MAQDWSATNTYVWNTTGQPVGSYNIQVLVRDAAAPPTYQTYRGVYFELRGTAACTAASTTITPSNVAVGTNVTVTTTASSCTSPEYAVYKKSPGGSFQLLSNYATENSNFLWDSTGAPLGTHTFQVWARAEGSTRTSEAIAATKAVLVQNSAPCSAATLTFAPAASASVGSTVALTGGASSCASPTFKYLIKPPGGVFQILQDWTSNPVFNWNTAFAAPGAYQFQIYSRNAGSTVTYESYLTRNYTLTGSMPSSVLAIGGGWQHHCQLLTGGAVGCWGYNGQGQMGNGTTGTSQNVPVAATGITTATGLGVGYYHTCALLADGTARCWGQNSRGQLGNGVTTASSSPVTVTGLSGATSIGTGIQHSCAVVGGAINCWGYNNQRQLGDGTTTNRTTPVAVPGINTATQVAGGYYHTCALLSAGTVTCWGYNANGQLGDGTTTSSPTPVAVSGLTNVVAISSFTSNNCALKNDGTVWCWGQNSAGGSLGNGSTTSQLTPVQVTGITNARSVSVGALHSCAVLLDGHATCWGDNLYGQLGNATNTSSAVPVLVSSLTNVATISVSNAASCATLVDGTTSCWGKGDVGALGNGTMVHSNVPVTVTPMP